MFSNSLVQGLFQSFLAVGLGGHHGKSCKQSCKMSQARLGAKLHVQKLQLAQHLARVHRLSRELCAAWAVHMLQAWSSLLANVGKIIIFNISVAHIQLFQVHQLWDQFERSWWQHQSRDVDRGAEHQFVLGQRPAWSETLRFGEYAPEPGVTQPWHVGNVQMSQHGAEVAVEGPGY